MKKQRFLSFDDVTINCTHGAKHEKIQHSDLTLKLSDPYFIGRYSCSKRRKQWWCLRINCKSERKKEFHAFSKKQWSKHHLLGVLHVSIDLAPVWTNCYIESMINIFVIWDIKITIYNAMYIVLIKIICYLYLDKRTFLIHSRLVNRSS